MGDPKKARKKYSSPRNPWRTDELSRELFLVGTYGLRNKRELWRAETELSRIRKQARALLAEPLNVRVAQERILLDYVKKMGIIEEEATLDDVLGLSIENLLERRLQTIVWRRGIARSPYQARQMVIHGHIAIGDRIVTIPSYLVRRDEEGSVKIRDGSPLLKTAMSEVAA